MMDKQITNSIKTIMDSNKLSIEELAKKANIEVTKLEKLLNNEISYTVEDLNMLSIALQYNLSTIILLAFSNDELTNDTLSDEALLKHIENNDVDYIVNCFLLNKIVRTTTHLHYVSNNGEVVKNKISDEITNKLYEFLIKNNYDFIASKYIPLKDEN